MSGVIAEFCANHKGDLGILEKLVYGSAKAGAGFAKIQSFFARDLSPEWCKARPGEFERIKQAELNWKAHEQFVQMCRSNNITPMTTVYSHKYLQEIKQAGFQYIKIGSAQAGDSDLISRCIISGFKVVLSTGGRDLDTDDVSKVGPLYGVLHCVSQYPSNPYESNLVRMLHLRRHWSAGSVQIGFSDHTDPTAISWKTPVEFALALGATLIEKHVTVLSRDATKDGPVSIDMDQLRQICELERMTPEERALDFPLLGILSYPQAEREKHLIKKFEQRWTC